MTTNKPAESLSGGDASTNRRSFLKTVTAGAAVVSGVPGILNATDKAGTKQAVIGTGEYQYQCDHEWGKLPDHVRWGETHGVAVDESGMIYIKHRNRAPEPMDSIVVFDPTGKYVRSFGKEYHAGGHGIDIRKEGNEEFLYLCDVTHFIFAKTTLTGEVVWRKEVPQEPELYTEGKKFSPTNIAFAPDGGFYVADGYGSHFIHQYDQNANWVRSWGGEGTKEGKFKTPHGLWLDNRPGRAVELVVADRANARLQYFTPNGEYLRSEGNVSFPAHFDIHGDLLLIPDLFARVTLLDRENKLITHLGYDQKWTDEVLGMVDGKPTFPVKVDPKRWQAGRFMHPHDACFDHAGNIFVVEWVPNGRVSFLKRV